MFHLLDDVDDVLDAAIVGTILGTAVTGAYFGGSKELAVYARLNFVVGLGIKRGPAEIAGWNETGIDDSGSLKG